MNLPLRILILFSALFLSPLFSTAQIVGGNNTYEFLNLPASARLTAMGGHLISVRDDDLSLALSNPSLLNPDMHQQIALSHNIFLGGINHGYVAYGHHAKKWNASLHAGLQYTTYGTFDAADEFGTITGEFKASEYAFVVGASRQVYEKLTFGANAKLITSQLETYNSVGLAADLGLFYQDTSGRFTASLVFKNAGAQLSGYTNENNEPLPFDIQIGISQRLKHLPFRFSVVYHNLQRWNLLYDDPTTEETTFIIGDGNQEESGFSMQIDNFFRHFVFSGEFLFGRLENFRLRFGYNHLRKQELSVDNFRSLAGFSMGLGFKIKRFRIDYGRSFYHLAGGGNHFSISTNLREFKKKG
ncbi:MAG: type IX secretion system protein PorQ [Bacteroidota bacterium]